MTDYQAAPYLRDLTDFQHRSVHHVFEQFYGPADATRFLVADETGLGKTRVARGLIARAIEHLQDDDSVRRIDVVYVCSNSDLARQNITRLNVTDQAEIPFSSRLTLLGAHSRRLNERRGPGKTVNLVSFTPGTSFESGHSLGQARERAMLFIILEQLLDFDARQATAAYRLLQGTVRTVEAFRRRVRELRTDIGDAGVDAAIVEQFHAGIGRGGDDSLVNRFQDLLSEMGLKRSVPAHLHDENVSVIRGLRAELARASVETLEPDLVILDEFQRFRHLLDETTQAGELAHHLFRYEAAKVLLLSATPYKPFSYVEESDDHAKGLFEVLGFLGEGRDDFDVDSIREQLRSYREVVLHGDTGSDIPARLRRDLLKVMSRAERPVLGEGTMSDERRQTADRVTADDLVGYSALHDVASLAARDHDTGLVSTEYWKSAPYFINFCEGYRLGTRLTEQEPTSQLRRALARTQRIDGEALREFAELDPGSARLRTLMADTVERNWWKLLWVPPSLPYLTPGGPFSDPGVQGMTKRLVFSSWTATPAAVSGVLSYEAERRAAQHTNYRQYTPASRQRLATHLQYTLRAGRPANMSTLLLHWPMPEFALVADPLALVAEHGGSAVTALQAHSWAETRLAAIVDVVPRQDSAPAPEPESREYWRSALSRAGNWPPGGSDVALGQLLRGDTPDGEGGEEATGASAHVALARTALEFGPSAVDHETLEVLADVALYSPANIAYRVLARIAGGADTVTDGGAFRAAAVLANGLRSLFNRPDAIKLVEKLKRSESRPFWRSALSYIADGNLEATLDEYLHHLVADLRAGPITDDVLVELARSAASAMSLRASTQRALDPVNPEQRLSFVPRFALRYGGRRADGEDVRLPEVRHAFNSPFWPFVLASTSVGQEGIDFHWWCHAVFHWNTPANPVDFEQREGRVDRYRGHAVRKNVAARHGTSALARHGGNPWDRLYTSATDLRETYGDFTPGWVYPGPAKIERHVAPLVLSSDGAKYDRVKKDVALYRLTFGQPRQEDMLELLHRRGVSGDPKVLQELRIDLSPDGGPMPGVADGGEPRA